MPNAWVSRLRAWGPTLSGCRESAPWSRTSSTSVAVMDRDLHAARDLAAAQAGVLVPGSEASQVVDAVVADFVD